MGGGGGAIFVGKLTYLVPTRLCQTHLADHQWSGYYFHTLWAHGADLLEEFGSLGVYMNQVSACGV